MIGGPLLPCSTCGAWAGDGALCEGCGAGRSGQDPVPLDQSPGDERWVVSRRGAPGRVAAALEAIVPGAPDSDEAALRVAAARRILAALSQSQQVSLTIDLRRAEAGHLAKSKRRGRTGTEQEYWVLPWLALRVTSGARAGLEAWVLRVTSVRRKRSFGSAGVEDEATRYHMDELRMEQPGRGRLRRPFRAPNRLSLDLAELDPDAPPPKPPPATAPRSAHAEGAPLLAGGLLSATLIGLLALLLGSAPAARAEVPGDWKALQAALTSGTPAPAVVRAGLLDGSGDRRREALLVAVELLPPRESGRALRVAIRDADPQVQALALDLAARAGESSAGLLASVVSGAQGSSTDRRLQALRLLVDRHDPRVVPLAIQGLQDGEAPNALRRAWIQALGAGADSRPPTRAAVATLIHALEDGDPSLRAQAGWALARVTPTTQAVDALVAALERTAKDLAAARGPQPDLSRAVVTLARAAAQVARTRARDIVERLLTEPHLPPRLARRLRRLLQGLAANDR